jgi:hypothetical protein
MENHPDYTEFFKLMRLCQADVLLGTRGNYTCFIPTNEAVLKYYETHDTSYENMESQPDVAKELVYDHIISGITIDYNSFDPGMISNATMSGRYVQIKKDNIDSIFVNRIAQIIRDAVQVVHNGSILPVNQIVEFSKVNLPEMIGSDGRFDIFAAALYATGLADSLRATEDFEYKELRRLGVIPIDDVSRITSFRGNPIRTPSARKFGYTLFVETDATLRQAFADAGISGDGLEALKAYTATKYPDGAAYEDTDPRSSLYQFTAYHLLYFLTDENDIIPSWWNEFYKSGLHPMYMNDFAETMARRLLEFQRVSGKLLLNRDRNGQGISIVPPGEKENASENGIFHEIDGVLLYDDNVKNFVLNKRIRIDIISLMPELMTNKIRGNFAAAPDGRSMYYQSIPTKPVQYLANCICSQETQMIYTGDYPNDMQSDELIFAGKYDVTFRLPSVPPGTTYEIRMGYTANSARSITQIYFDGDPCGIPMDLKIGSNASDPLLGWEADNNNPEHDKAVDKAMRNRGYMKYPDILSGSTYGRGSSQTIRKIITSKTFNEEGSHLLRFKSVEVNESAEFMIDFIEYVPKTVFGDNEDIY